MPLTLTFGEKKRHVWDKKKVKIEKKHHVWDILVVFLNVPEK